MKKGNEYVGKVSRIAFPNKGIVCTEGEKVVVKNTIPGQTVSFILSKNKSGSKEGRLLEIKERSPMECFEGCCGVYEKCGGCIYQTISYEDELKIKQSQLVTLFDNFFKSEPLYEGISAEDMIRPIISSPDLKGYRNKMEYSFGDEFKGGPLTLGMHVTGHFNDIVNTEGCNIANPDLEAIRSFTRDFFASTGLPFYHRTTGEGFLRHLLVRTGVKTGEILVCIVTTDPEEHKDILEDFAGRLRNLSLKGRISGILNIVNNSVADAVKAEDIRILYGKDHFFEEVLGLKFRITPFSFFQTNTRGAEVLYRTAADLLPVKGTVFDLYSGTGTIAQILASRCDHVLGIEIVEEAVLSARENAALNGIDNAGFIAGDVLKCLESTETRPDVIVMDPPRDGASPKALKKILSYGVDHILYISCKITSFIRDLKEFTENGYRLQAVVPVDLFPRTANVETVCLLSQRKPDTTIEVDLDISELEVSSAETKATYEEIKSYVLKKFGLKVSNLYIAQVKRECGIVERINYNLPKTEGNRVPQCPEDKRKAIKDAFIHFQMI